MITPLLALALCGATQPSIEAGNLRVLGSVDRSDGIDVRIEITNASSAPLDYLPGGLPWVGVDNIEMQLIEISDKVRVLRPIGPIADAPRLPKKKLQRGESIGGLLELQISYPQLSKKSTNGYVFACWSYKASRAFAGSAEVFSGCNLLIDPARPER